MRWALCSEDDPRQREGNQYLYPHETTAAAAAIYVLLLVLLIDCQWTSDGRAAGSHVAAMDDRRRAGEKDVSGVQ